MKAILLAGGKGTRLRPLTSNMPKPIVPILNRPFLLYQLDLLRRVGSVDEVILSLNYQPDQIEELIDSLPNLGLKIRYLVEPQPGQAWRDPDSGYLIPSDPRGSVCVRT